MTHCPNFIMHNVSLSNSKALRNHHKAIVTKNASDLQWVLRPVHELSLVLGFQTNLGKTEVYRWATTPRSRQWRQVPHHDVLRWNDTYVLVIPLVIPLENIMVWHLSPLPTPRGCSRHEC